MVNNATPIDYYAEVAELGLQFDPTFGTVHFKVIDRDDGGQPVVIGTVRRDGCANADMFTPNDGVQLHWCDLQQYAAFSEALGWAVKTAMETAAKGPHLV